jgi:hypothetical protein
MVKGRRRKGRRTRGRRGEMEEKRRKWCREGAWGKGK